MRFKVKFAVAALCALNGIAMGAYGATDSKDQPNDPKAAMVHIANRSEVMEEQIIALQKTLADLQNAHQELQQEQRKLQKQIAPGETLKATAVPPPGSVEAAKAAQNSNVSSEGSHPAQTLDQTGPAGSDNVSPFDAEKIKKLPYGQSLLGSIGGTAVITAPFIQSRYEYGGTGMIVNYSSINKDVSVLFQRQDFARQMREMGLKLPGYPLLEISGKLEGQFFAARGYTGHHTSDLDLSAAELDFQALINRWFTGFMSVAYNNAPPASGSRVSNSVLYIDNAFITVGNFRRSPFYLTIGQDYVPFGQFDSYLITDSIAKTLFRTKARALTLGYQAPNNQGLYAAVYAFRADTHQGDIEPGVLVRAPSSTINTYGANLGYEFTTGKFHLDLATSYINNVADSVGMQNTFAPSNQFQGFGASSASEVLAYNIPGVDVRAEMSYDDFLFIAEYTAAIRTFNPANLTYNGDGARPDAYHLEGIYSFSMFNRPSSFSVGYDHSREALGLNVPNHRYAATVSTSLWRNTLASLEYRRDVNYAAEDYASGDGGPVFSRQGEFGNAVTAHFDVFF